MPSASPATSPLVFLGNVWTPGGRAAEHCIGHARAAEELGYVNVGWSDQTQGWVFRAGWDPEFIPGARIVPDHDAWFETLTLAGAVLGATDRVALATMIDSYRRPPAVLAQMLNTLDHVGHGRFTVAVGSGENKQFEPYGMERTEPRNARLEEFIATTKLLMATQEPVTRESRFFPLREAVVGVPPYRPDRTLPVLVLGGGPRIMQIAGRTADGWGTYLPGAFADDVGPFEESLAQMHAAAADSGRDPLTIVPPIGCEVTMMCETDEQVERCYDSLYTKMFVLNLTPTGAHWRQWGGEHPLGDDWALSATHRSTKFTRDELLDICAKVGPGDIDHMLYLGTPEDVAQRAAKWYRAIGLPALPQILHWDAATFVCPELAEPGPAGTPRWHDLHLRYLAALNKHLAGG